MTRKKVIVVGGGTGTYTVLLGLKKYPLELSAIISMMDSGGSNRVLRDEFGLLPTSDLRKCMVALASPKSHEILRKLFTYRFSQGTGIAGMTFGNLFMAALTEIYGSQEESIIKTSEILDVKGQIIPVTYDDTHLIARYDNGEQVLGEHFIDEPKKENGKHKIIEFELIPKARANKKALQAIKEADLIVFGPGDLYTSIICNLLVEGIAEAIKKSKAKKVYVLNLMTKFGQTNNYTAKDHLADLEKYLGEETIDAIVVNKTQKFPPSIIRRYKEEKAFLVKDGLEKRKGLKIIKRDLVCCNKVYFKNPSDKLKRSLIRHDSDKLAKTLIKLL
jgi:uncharacterized cofD-like protein